MSINISHCVSKKSTQMAKELQVKRVIRCGRRVEAAEKAGITGWTILGLENSLKKQKRLIKKIMTTILED